jgi:hypothetical protein
MMPPLRNFPNGMLAGEFYDNGDKLAVLRPLRFVDPEYGIEVTVPIMATTDFNSTPRIVWSFFPKWQYPEAGAVHDWIFRHPPGGWTRENCNWVHWRILRLCGMSRLKAEIVFQALSLGSKGAWDRYRVMERNG